MKAQHIILLKTITEEHRSRSRQYECCNICGIQLLDKVSILMYALGATTVKFITSYMVRSYGQLSAIKYVISKTRVKNASKHLKINCKILQILRTVTNSM